VISTTNVHVAIFAAVFFSSGNAAFLADSASMS